MVRRMLQRKPAERGDTLVEVLMAIVVLSAVIVGAITIMNRSMAAIQLASEHTQVRFQVTSQSEMLRRLRDGYQSDPSGTLGQVWMTLFNAAPPYADTVASSNGGACEVTSGKQPFYLRQATGQVQLVLFDQSVVPATVAVPGQGMWIEATRSPSGITPGYVDFQFRACWDGSGGSAGQQQILNVVRLYDPAH